MSFGILVKRGSKRLIEYLLEYLNLGRRIGARKEAVAMATEFTRQGWPVICA